VSRKVVKEVILLSPPLVTSVLSPSLSHYKDTEAEGTTSSKELYPPPFYKKNRQPKR